MTADSDSDKPGSGNDGPRQKVRTKKRSPKNNESDSEAEEEKEPKRGKYDDFVEIVCVVKPRHERTWEIIDLSSEEIEAGSDDQN